MRDDTPPITDAMREAAAQQRGGFLYVIDPVFEGEENVPGEGIMGAFSVGSDGSIGSYKTNPKHSPERAACLRFEPTNDIERLVCDQFINKTSESALVGELKRSQLFVPVLQSSPDQPLLFESSDRTKELHVFTSEARVEGERSQYGVFEGAELLSRIPDGTIVVINHGSVVSIRIHT